MMTLAYSTIKSIRDGGISAARMADSEVSRLICQYSKMITRLVETWFIPVSVVKRYNGGGNVIQTGLPPVIKLFGVSIVNPDQSRTVIDPLEYEAIGKIIRFNKKLIDGVKNIEVEGIFGEIDNVKHIPVKITTDIIEGSESFDVEDASELEARDIFVFDNKILIANSINYTDNTVLIDKQQNIKPILSGTETTCFGCVPYDIDRATCLMVKNSKILEKQIGGKIKSEKTDDYQYELFQSGEMSTGIPEVDRILQTYLEGEVTLTYL